MDSSIPDRRIRWLALSALFLVILFARAVLVGLYAESVPYWDQWDAEGRRLVAPLIEGTLTWNEVLINPHNEHRVAWSRLLFLTLFLLNGDQWDNLVGAYANTLLFAAIYTFLFVVAVRGLRSLWQQAVLAGVLLVLAALPYAWENTINSFQSQFYFLVAFAVATLALAASKADSTMTLVGVVALAIGSIFTMASGVLIAPVAATVLGLRLKSATLGRARGLVTIAILAIIALVGVLTVPHVEGHAHLKADSVPAWLAGFMLAASWPLSPSWFHLLLVWSPLLVFCALHLRHRLRSSADLLMFGMAAWALAQAAAIGYSRGRYIEGQELSSRYGDIMAIAVIANIWFALRVLDPGPERTRTLLALRAAALASVAVVLVALFQRLPKDLVEVLARSDSCRRQTENVRAFVADGDRTHLDGMIPYPHAEQLEQMLMNPAIRGALPPTLRKGLSLKGATREPFTVLGSTVTSCSTTQCAEGVGHWRSADLRTRFDFIRLRFVYGERNEGFKLRVCGSERRCALEPLRGQLLTVPVPAETFHIELADATAASWIAMGSAIEVNRLSLLSRYAKAWTRRAIPHSSDFSEPLVTSQGLPCEKASSEPWNLMDGASLHAEVPVGRAGLLTRVTVLRGSLDRNADGWLHTEVCAAGRCAASELRLRRVRHRHGLGAPLPTPLTVRPGDKLHVRLWTAAVTRPVALSSCLPEAGSARVWADPPCDTHGRTLRMALEFLQVD